MSPSPHDADRARPATAAASAPPHPRRGFGWPLLITLGLAITLTPFVIAAVVLLGG